jgi:hypothetical protein
MKRFFVIVTWVVFAGLAILLSCTRENPTAPGRTVVRKGARARAEGHSEHFWPCSTEAQVDSAFQNFGSGDTIYIYSRIDGEGHIISYDMASTRDTILNSTLYLFGEDTTAVLRSRSSGSAFLTCIDNDDVNDFVLQIKNLKLCKPANGTGSLLYLSQNTISLENCIIADSCGQGYLNVNFLSIDGSSFRNKGHFNILTHPCQSNIHHSLEYEIENSVFCQYEGATGTTNYNIEHDTYANVEGTITISGCEFFDQEEDTVYMKVLAYRPSVLDLELSDNYLYDGRLTCQVIAGAPAYTISVTYDGNHENVGKCYEDVLSTVCSGCAGCATEVQIDNWYYSSTLYGEGTLYGRDMFSNIGWSKNTEEGQIALAWNTTASCRGYVEVFSGDDCATEYAAEWDSTVSTSHDVTFNADLCNTYSAKIYALPDGCDSLIAEGVCRSYDPRPNVEFDDFTWSEDAELGQLTPSWSTSEMCMGLVRVYSGQSCGSLIASVWDSAWSTSHSVTFDADYCAYTSARIYALVAGCDSLIPEGICRSHYFEPDVQFSNLSHSQDALNCTMTISWNTDVACKGMAYVYTGTVCGSAYGTYYDNDVDTSHSVTFGIDPSTDYSWKVYARFADCYVYEGTCHYAKSGKCINHR